MNIDQFISKKPYLIAGPCSAESEKQISFIAESISNKVDVFRAGIWKPRTNPKSFEGIGSIGLEWLKNVKKRAKIKVATEVGTAAHVEKCLNAGIDILWIGARTTVNPFYVQEIAQALSGVDIPVFVKNPIHPDIGLWIGALERLNNNGVTKIAAIHRGFFTYESSAYRNDPKWEIPIALRRNLPSLPIICDSSHIAGNTNLVSEVSQIAMDLDMDGLMIETHDNPDIALSDSKQQVTPKELLSLFKSLILRKQDFKNRKSSKELKNWRREIDKLDDQIIKKLYERKLFVEDIARFKLQNGLTIFQLERWFEILKTRKHQGRLKKLDPKMISDIFELIHKYSILTQTNIMKEK